LFEQRTYAFDELEIISTFSDDQGKERIVRPD
jgi:hypothetical protein